MTKALIVLTSHENLGETDEKTGFYLSEASHPWKIFTQAGWDVEIASIKGGDAPIDGKDLRDADNKEFYEKELYKNTKSITKIDPNEYDAIFLAGGHGTMWDFPDNKDLQKAIAGIYEEGGIVGAVCHGPAGIVNVKVGEGEYIVKGKEISCFTDSEEKAVEKENIVPFMLESQLKKHGAKMKKSDNFKKCVAVDGRIVTGQNPASAKGVAQEMVEMA